MNYVATGQRQRFLAKDINNLAKNANDKRFPLSRRKAGTKQWPSGWSGCVVFDNLRGLRSTSVLGTATDFLRCWFVQVGGGPAAGVLEYSDGTDLEAWPDGASVHKISDIAGDLHVG
jgi:hypothetical protein